MKSIILVIIAMTGLSANASFLQENCSDSEGTTQVSNGHVKNELSITKRTFTQGEMIDETMVLPFARFDVSYGDDVVLEEIETGSCQPGDKSAFVSYTKIFAKKIMINRIDRSLFDANVVGVNKSRTTVERHLVCRRYINNSRICP